MSNKTNIDIYLSELEVSKRDIKGAIQSKGVTPTGGLSSYAEAILNIPTSSVMGPLEETITEGGEYSFNPIDDGVEGYNSVKINVDIEIPEIPTFETQSKEVTIKKNGTTSIVPDSGYDGLSSVEVTVQVSTGGSDKPQILNGFAFTGGDIAQVDFSQYDWSMVYDTSEFFRNCYHSTGDWSNFLENFNGEILSLKHMFAGTQTTQNAGVQSLPNLGNRIAGITSTAYMCNLNPSLNDVSSLPQWDTSKVTDASYMFGSDQSSTKYNPDITSVDLTNFGSPDGYKAYYMFAGCLSLESITGILHPAGNAQSMFYNCRNLTSIPQMDTSNVTNMGYMFSECQKLTSIPQMDTSNVTNMGYMFYNCGNLTSVPQMDTSNVTNMNYMFKWCSALTSIPQMDVSKVTNVEQMFAITTSLPSKYKSLPDFNFMSLKNFGGQSSYSWVYGQHLNLESYGVIDCDSITDIGYVFGNSSNSVLTQIGGFRNLGKASSVSNTNGNYFMIMAPNLNYQSVLNVLNGLYDRASAGLSVLTLKLHANHLAMLSEDDIAIATNKGWTIV